MRKSVQVPQYGWLKQLEKKPMEQSDAIPAGWFGDVKGPVRDSLDIAQKQYSKSGAKTSRKWVESEISGILGDIRSYDECTQTDRSRRKSVDMRLPPCRNIRSRCLPKVGVINNTRDNTKKDVGVLMRTRSMRVCPPIPEPIEKEELQQIHEVRQMKEVEHMHVVPSQVDD